MKTETPYERHAKLGHGDMSRYSPNGVDIVEECQVCNERWLHNPCFGYPITLPHKTPEILARDKAAIDILCRIGKS